MSEVVKKEVAIYDAISRLNSGKYVIRNIRFIDNKQIDEYVATFKDKELAKCICNNLNKDNVIDFYYIHILPDDFHKKIINDLLNYDGKVQDVQVKGE